MVLVRLYSNETLTEKYFDDLRPSGLLRHYTEILQSPLFLGYSILGGLALMMVGFSFALPQCAAAALTPFAHMAGTAASAAGFLQYTIGAGAAALLSRFDHSDQPPLARVLMTLSVLRPTLAELLRRRAQDERTSPPARFGTAGLPKRLRPRFLLEPSGVSLLSAFWPMI